MSESPWSWATNLRRCSAEGGDCKALLPPGNSVRQIIDRNNADLELLAQIRTPGKPLQAFLELMETKRADCAAEVAYCESRCEDDVIAISRQCLELVESIITLLRGTP